MALLYRFVKIHDRSNSHVFTFVITKSVTRDPERDVTCKEFSCGHQRWAITFSRADKVLGVFLVWKSACENMRVYVDFTFTLLNRQHFSVNESFSGKQVKFTAECPAQGSRHFVPVADLYARHFTDTNGEFQLALCLGNIRTMVDTTLTVSTSIFSNLPLGALASSLTAHRHHTQSGATGDPSGGNEKLETSYFTFGGFDWNVTLYPGGIRHMHGSPDQDRISVYLQRCTGFDHQCRVRYSIVLGDGDRRIDSGVVDDVSDSDGKSYGWHPRVKFHDLVHKGVIRVHLEMHLANTLSEVISSIVLSQSDSTHTSGVIAAPAISQCYDRDKQAWSVKSDCHSETVRLHMVYKDIQNVPRNHLRFVSWTAYLLRYHGKANHVEPIPLPGAPFSHYYAQDASDEGIIMETDVPVKELKEPGCSFLTDKGQLRVQIEWEESYLLFQATYHKYDDVSRLHNTQMRREIQALQAENYSLERQLFSYQKSLAYAHSRGTISDDLTPPDGRADEEEQFFHENGAYSLGDRSISTDTDYA
uniref:MATH domain-containing protein n=1 Tax=Cacopsylla melanoneura TaxID=428564 RepID=A0A8D8QVL2_9HEMI